MRQNIVFIVFLLLHYTLTMYQILRYIWINVLGSYYSKCATWSKKYTMLMYAHYDAFPCFSFWYVFVDFFSISQIFVNRPLESLHYPAEHINFGKPWFSTDSPLNIGGGGQVKRQHVCKHSPTSIYFHPLNKLEHQWPVLTMSSSSVWLQTETISAREM